MRYLIMGLLSIKKADGKYGKVRKADIKTKKERYNTLMNKND